MKKKNLLKTTCDKIFEIYYTFKIKLNNGITKRSLQRTSQVNSPV